MNLGQLKGELFDEFVEEKLIDRIEQVDPGFGCPLIAAHCMDTQDKYGYYAKYVLHPYCLTTQ